MNHQRFDAVDLLRGVAMVWMTVFHFCFDLNLHGYIKQDFTQDGFWTLQRSAIVSLFVFCAGLGQAIAQAQAQTQARFWRRWSQIAGCAVLVSLGSAWMFPKTWIYFGVLHGIAVMLLIARFGVTRRGLTAGVVAALGLTVIAAFFIAPSLISMGSGAEYFNSKWLNWLGAVTHKPYTEDFVPLLPWFGVMLLGLAAGQWLLAHRASALALSVRPALRWLSVLGRWSLSYYMVHQPVLLGLLWLYRAMV